MTNYSSSSRGCMCGGVVLHPDRLAIDGQRDEIYCGEGRDSYWADKSHYVDSSCEKKLPKAAHGPDPLPICTKSFEGMYAGCLAERLRLRPAPLRIPRWRILVVLPSFCRRPCCCSGLAS